jgi:L-lysine exporter family protein LysE/ArgO
LTAVICSVIDALLITLGVLGFGKFISANPLFIVLSKYFALVFLFFYGLISLKSAFKLKNFTKERKELLPSTKKTILCLLALSLLNPHVYLDTVILLGSIASQHPFLEQIYFAIGAICASFMWFFSLTYGSRLLAPLLSKSSTWMIIDILIAVTMWGMGVALMWTL